MLKKVWANWLKLFEQNRDVGNSNTIDAGSTAKGPISMLTPLRILILEDRIEDAELILRELKRGGFDPQWERVQTEADFLVRLDENLDIILSDFSMPGFNAQQALARLKEKDFDIPFIIVTGTISEEIAVESIKLGADDYLLKDRLGRLSQSINQALERKRVRIQNRRMEDALVRRDRIMQAVGFAAERFLTAGGADLSASEVLDRLGKATKVSRVLLFENRVDASGMQSTSVHTEWLSNPLHSQPANEWLDGAPLRMGKLERWADILSNGGTVQGPLKDFPLEERLVLAYRAVRSMLMVPIFVGQNWWGQIAFEDCVTERDWFSAEIDAVKVAAGTLGAAIQRQSTEEALRKSEEQLQQSQKMEAIGTLAGGIAHDFNNLLTAILGNAQLALTDSDVSEALNYRLLEIEKAGNRATALTRQLLAFSRRQRLQRRVINLNETISDVSSMIQRIIGEDIEIEVRSDPKLSLVSADPAQIEQVIMNLAVNARDAMPDGGRLLIETENGLLDDAYCRKYPYARPGEYAVMTISDNGVGMNEELMARIFEPFFTTKEIGRGTGLGLAMVYGIVKQHEGHINVHSEIGSGTSFKVYLHTAAVAGEEDSVPIFLPVVHGTETILIAEDEDALRGLAKDVLETLGYSVLVARNGVECVEIFSRSRASIDLLLLDVVMPRMGGHEAYEKIFEISPEVPVIFMTGYSAETVQDKFLNQNHFFEDTDKAFLQKPYNVETLGRKVREVLDAKTPESLMAGARNGAQTFISTS